MYVDININGEEFEAEVEYIYEYEPSVECVNPHESVDEVFEITQVLILGRWSDTDITFLCSDDDGQLFKSIYNQIKKQIEEE